MNWESERSFLFEEVLVQQIFHLIRYATHRRLTTTAWWGLCTTDWLKSIFVVYSVKRLRFNSCIALLCAALNELTKKEISWLTAAGSCSHCPCTILTHGMWFIGFVSAVNPKNMETMFVSSVVFGWWEFSPTSNCHQLQQKTIFPKGHVNTIHSLTLPFASTSFAVVKCIKRCIIMLKA